MAKNVKSAPRKNKPGAGRPPTGRTYRINNVKVLQIVGEEMAQAAAIEGWAPLLERLWVERR